MSPRGAAEFGERWPALQRRLQGFLRAKGVPPGDIDDLVQEVAARLVSFWHKVEPDRPLWPLTVTIALNLIRDRSRRPELEFLGELPDVAGNGDVADASIAKLELAAVIRAMDSLTASQRAALLQVLDADEGARATSAEKMLRLRARRRLANAVGRACGGLVLKTRKLGDAIHGFFTKADSVAQALACATCLFVASAGSATMYSPLEGFNFDIGTAAPAAIAAATYDTHLMPSVSSSDALSLSASEELSPSRATLAGATTSPTGSSDNKGGAKGAHQAAGSEAGSTGTGLAVSGSPVVPTNAPLPAPEPPGTPGAPDQPTQVPSVDPGNGDAPASPPVQLPVGDDPAATVEEVTTLVGEASE